jgi:purine catabolism regulator
MNLPSVQTLQRLAFPSGTRLLAGSRGLTRGVSWPSTLRTRPPAFASVKPGEFLLIATASLALLDPDLSLARLLQTVGRIGISGAAIVGEIPLACEAWAEEHDVPLFALPANSHLADVESAIARAIADTRSEYDRRAHEIYRQLTQIAIEERGLPSIVEGLATVTGKPSLILDGDLAVRFRHPDGTATNGAQRIRRVLPVVEEWTKRVPISAAEPPVKFFELDGDEGLLLAPVMTRDGIALYLSVWSSKHHLDTLDEAAVGSAAAAAAIEMTRERAVMEAEERAQAGVIEELTTGVGPFTESLRRRSARLQIDLEQDHVVMVATVAAAPTPTALDACLRDLRAVARFAHAGMVDGNFAAIVGPSEKGLHGLAEGFREGLARRFGNSEVSLGAGRWKAGLEGVRQSYREAKEALRLGLDIFGAGRTTLYSDLGLYRLILSVRDHPEVERFYRETMGKLAAQDARSNGELLRTLEAYFSSNGSPTEAAARLHVHRNTLLYRLQRIRSVAELDLDDPEVRLALQVGLRIRRVQRATEDGRPGSSGAGRAG